MAKFKMIINVDLEQLVKLRNEADAISAEEEGKEFTPVKGSELPVDEVIFLIKEEMGWIATTGISVDNIEPVGE